MRTDTQQLLDRFGLALDRPGHVVMTDYTEAGKCYVHNSQVPVAIAAFTMVSPVFARGRFPKKSFIDLIHKRPSMDELEVVTFAAVCGVEVEPPFWSNGGPFGEHLWDVIERYQLEPYFERVERRYGSVGDHYLMRPRGLDWSKPDNPELPGGLAKWRAEYRKLPVAKQILVTAILQLYKQGEDRWWQVRVPKAWHAAEALQILKEVGYLADFARLYALYPGW